MMITTVPVMRKNNVGKELRTETALKTCGTRTVLPCYSIFFGVNMR